MERDRPSSGKAPDCVKLLRWRFFCFCLCFSIRFRIAFTIKRCVSANQPYMVGGWVQVGGF